MRIVLASQSPRRRELLTQAGVVFDIQVADIDESVHPNEDPAAYTTRLALEKAQAVFARLGAPSNTAVLGADTTVVVDNTILGKPEEDADAARMLRLLSGRAHTVVTGIAVVTAQQMLNHAEVTSVYFTPMSEKEIAAYIATGEPMDKAGAYGIQGRAARYIPRIEGDYTCVVGLPVAKTCALLQQAGAL